MKDVVNFLRIFDTFPSSSSLQKIHFIIKKNYQMETPPSFPRLMTSFMNGPKRGLRFARKFFGSPPFQPDDIFTLLLVIFKPDFSSSVIERADFSHDPLESIFFWRTGIASGISI